MGKGMNYFDYAENDYIFYRANYEEHRIGNAMCSSSQGICERYLKHLVDLYCTDEDTTSVLRTHSLRVLKKFISNKLEDFQCDWNVVLGADGFYFSTRYPGDESFFADEEDVEVCWKAVEEVRRSVMAYCDRHPVKKSPLA